MSSINFDNIWLLLIAIPLLALFIVPFALAVRKDNRNGHNIASLAIHILLAIVVAFAAAGTNIVTVLSETDVIVVADVSYSANRNLDTVDTYIKNLGLPANSKLGVVCFGKDHELLYGLGDPEGFTTVKDSKVDDSETNIAEALEYAGTLFGDNVIKNVVLITDGRQTDETDAYAVKRAVSELRARNINVDAIYLNDNITSDAREVQISNVTFTADTYINHEETAQVSGCGHIRLRSDRDRRKRRKPIQQQVFVHADRGRKHKGAVCHRIVGELRESRPTVRRGDGDRHL